MATTQTTYVAFDAQSGRILSVHHGAKDEQEARASLQHLPQIDETYVAHGQVGVIAVSAAAIEPGKQYKIDVGRKALVATQEREGVAFGVGSAGRTT
jgi:hypothetical protein